MFIGYVPVVVMAFFVTADGPDVKRKGAAVLPALMVVLGTGLGIELGEEEEDGARAFASGVLRMRVLLMLVGVVGAWIWPSVISETRPSA